MMTLTVSSYARPHRRKPTGSAATTPPPPAAEAPNASCGRNNRLALRARLDARNSVESGAVLPHGLGALGPDGERPENAWRQSSGRPFGSVDYPGR
jgi:hypothetical protein